MRLTLVISSLAGGGAERVMARLAGQWVEQMESVTLITLYPESHDFVSLDPRVKRRVVGHTEVRPGAVARFSSAMRRLQRLRREVIASRPDAVVSFMTSTNILVLLARSGTRIPVIVSERIDPRYHEVGRTARLLRRLLYPRAKRVVVQSAVVEAWAREFLPSERVARIANPVAAIPAKVGAEQGRGRGERSPMGAHTIVAMGRLDPQKGFDVLIQAFARLARTLPGWRLVIAGEGPQRAALAELARREGVSDRLELSGWVDSPSELLREAELFVLSSRFEGFPNALLEAMAHGVPVVATDCPSGPAEIVREGVDGYLVPPDDVAALAEGMRRLMLNPEERARLGRAAAEVCERFSLERISSEWNELLETCTR
ncbi:glycosyltransferase family 4 protein [soil metagenome]